MADKKDYPKIAAIQIRGTVGVTAGIKDTLTMLNLRKKNNCVVLPGSPVILGMLAKVKDYATWGLIDAETEKLLENKRKAGKTYLLSPPVGGFEKGGIKKSFSQGGVLGNRKEKINDIIKRMVK